MRIVLFAAATLIAAAPAAAQQAQNAGRSATAHAEDMRDNNREGLQRDVAQFKRMTQGDRRKLVEEYRKETDAFRTNALQIAETAKGGATFPADAPGRIRAALEMDMTMWKNSFQLSDKEWKGWKDAWLVDVGKLDGAQWAAQRAAWFAARDAWLDKIVAAKR